MRLIKVTGGLGNQMFIYAFYLRIISVPLKWDELNN